MTDDIWQMPQPMAVLEAIEEWRSLDLRTATFDSIVVSMEALRDKLEFWVVQRNTSSPQKLWRVRKRKENDSFDTVGDLWEPCASKAGLNRCNQTGSPVLYCSKDLATALDECDVATGDELLLVTYRASSQLRLNRIVGNFDPNPTAGDPIIVDDGLLAYRIMREFLRAEFTKPVGKGTEAIYNVSAAVCHVWAGSDDADGWIYPSIRSPLRGNDNLAVYPSSARSKLDIESGHWCMAEDVQASELRLGGSPLVLPGIRLRHLKVAEVGEREIRWRPPGPSEENAKFARRR
jgi:hypothetical protein